MRYTRCEQLDGPGFFAEVGRLWAGTLKRDDRSSPTPDDYESFDAVQEAVLEALLDFEELRRNANGLTSKERRTALGLIARAQRLYRRAADAIAWQLLDGQLWIARRLYSGSAPPHLRDSNWKATMAAARALRRQDGDSFALYADLTSFIGNGDLLQRTTEGFTLIEVKEGEKNRQILGALNAARHGCKVPLGMLLSEGEKSSRHIERVVGQATRIARAAQIINEGKGEELGRQSRVPDEYMREVSFADRVGSAIVRSAERDWALDVIDSCLYLGAYRGWWRSGIAFEKIWMDHEAQGDGPLVNLATNFSIPLAQPLHLHRELQPYAVEIASGEVVVYMQLALEKFVALGRALGLTVDWMTRADTERYARRMPRNEILRWKNRGIGARYKASAEVALGNALVGRMFFDQMTPISAWEMTGSSLVTTYTGGEWDLK
jgi:hypothetical protein